MVVRPTTPRYSADISAVPADVAVTSPAELTVATNAFDVAQATPVDSGRTVPSEKVALATNCAD